MGDGAMGTVNAEHHRFDRERAVNRHTLSTSELHHGGSETERVNGREERKTGSPAGNAAAEQ